VDEYAHAMAELLLRPGASATRRRMAIKARKHVEVRLTPVNCIFKTTHVYVYIYIYIYIYE